MKQELRWKLTISVLGVSRYRFACIKLFQKNKNKVLFWSSVDHSDDKENKLVGTCPIKLKQSLNNYYFHGGTTVAYHR